MNHCGIIFCAWKYVDRALWLPGLRCLNEIFEFDYFWQGEKMNLQIFYNNSFNIITNDRYGNYFEWMDWFYSESDWYVQQLQVTGGCTNSLQGLQSHLLQM